MPILSFTSLRRVFRFGFSCFILSAATLALSAEDGPKKSFDVPAGTAGDTLKTFARQAGREIVFAAETVEAVNTNAVKGELTPGEAIETMLADTGLIASQDAKTGAFAVRKGESPNAPRAALNSGRPQNQPASNAEQTLALPTFEVNARRIIGTGESRATFTLDRARIEEQTAGTDITVALKSIPGVQVSTGDARGGSFSWELYVRGLNKEQIGFSLDGIPTGDARFNGGQPPDRFIDAANISRIVVSKSSGEIGSPSRFALGGFVNFVTDEPLKNQTVAFNAGFGSFDYRFVSARVDVGEIAEGLTGYASYSHRESANYAGPKSRSNNRDHFEVKLTKVFSPKARVSVRASYNDQRDNDFNIISLQEFKANPRSDRANDQVTGVPALDIDYGGALGGTRQDWLVYTNLELRPSDMMTVEVKPYIHSLRGESYRYQDRNRRLNSTDPRAVTGYNANSGAIRPGVITTRDSNAFGGPADMRVTPRNRDRSGITGELKIENVAGFNTIRIGGWYEQDEANEFRNFYPLIDSRSGIAYNRNALAYVEYERTSKLDNTMFYAQDRVALLEGRLNFDLGVTYIDTGYDVVSPLEYSTRVAFAQNSGLLPKLGVYYRPMDSLEVFAGAARNFSGLPEDVFLGSSAIINRNLLTPLKTDNLDMGLRYLAGKFAFSVQGYYVDLKNTIGIVPQSVGVGDFDDVIRGNVATRAVNLSGIESYGGEITTYVKLGQFDLYTAYARQEAKHKDPGTAAERLALARNGIIAGARVRDIPQDSVTTTVGWEPTDRLRLTGTLEHVGRRVGGHIIAPSTANPATAFDRFGNPVSANQAIEVETIDGRTLVGLSCRYRPKALSGLTFELNVDNLFDQTYIGSVSSATTTLQEFGVVGGNGYTLDRYFIGFPRTVTFSVRARF